jgi:hypothetical protein
MKRAVHTLPAALVALSLLTLPAPASAAGSGSPTIVHTHGQDIEVNTAARAGIAYRRGYVASHPAAAPRNTSGFASRLPYGGGAIVAGAPKVYLVFWGSQWGAASTGGDGYQHYTGDPKHIAPVEQAFFAGLGTNSETWSGVMTQYCQGVAIGAFSCGPNTTHVGYPTGGALTGVWEDTAVASPNQATQNQIAAEAVLAATHFGNADAASNVDAQYVILSPTGTNPDNYLNSGFCAWHSATFTRTATIAYTNMPYITDVGQPCYEDAVNTNGPLDGITVVGGHEYSETITDPNPGDPAWWDLADNTGGENADKCSLGLGFNGANLALSTGSFAVQPTYSNDAHSGAGGCSFSHSIWGVGGAGSLVSVSTNGTGSGSVTSSPAGVDCGATCTASFTNGTSVTLTATPDAGSEFRGWSGGGCSGTGTCTFTVNSGMSLTATFGLIDVTDVVVTGQLSGGYRTSGKYRLYRISKKVSYGCSVSPDVAGGERADFELDKSSSDNWKVFQRFHGSLDQTSALGVIWPKKSLPKGSYSVRCSVAATGSHGAGESKWSYFQVTS